MLLEEAGEMLGIVKAELLGCVGDGLAADEEFLGALHEEAANDAGGSVACQLTDEVAEVVGREEEFLCAIADRGQTMLLLQGLAVVALQEIFKTGEQVGVVFGRNGELAGIEAAYILQHQTDAMHQNVTGVFIVAMSGFLPNLLQESDDGHPLLVGHEQRLDRKSTRLNSSHLA